MLFGYSLWGGLLSCADCAVVATGLNRHCLTCLTGPGWPWGSVNIYSVWPWLCRPPVKHDSCSVCSLSTTLCPLTEWCKGAKMSQGWKLLQRCTTSPNQFGSLKQLQQSQTSNLSFSSILLKLLDKPFTLRVCFLMRGRKVWLHAPRVLIGLSEPTSYLKLIRRSGEWKAGEH